MISLPLSILWLITLLGETEPHFFGTSMKDRLEIGSIPIREKNLEATAMVPKLPYGPPYNNQRTFVQDTENQPESPVDKFGGKHISELLDPTGSYSGPRYFFSHPFRKIK